MKFIVTLPLAFVSVIFLSGFSFFETLPNCNEKEVKQVIKEMVQEAGETFISLKDISEEGYNSSREIRLCSATLASTAGAEYVQYHISWQNKSKGMFWVQLVE